LNIHFAKIELKIFLLAYIATIKTEFTAVTGISPCEILSIFVALIFAVASADSWNCTRLPFRDPLSSPSETFLRGKISLVHNT